MKLGAVGQGLFKIAHPDLFKKLALVLLLGLSGAGMIRTLTVLL